jgi:probable rRNA maturation factor
LKNSVLQNMSSNVITNVQINSPHWNAELADAENLCQLAATAVWEIALKLDKAFEVTIVLADDNLVQTLNHKYRNQNKPTNVLSFPSSFEETVFQGDLPTLGDVVVAFETAKAEARSRLSEHLSHLVVHGCLHLLGYDHEDDVAAQEMEGLEVRILIGLGIKNPYDAVGDCIMN